MCLCIHIYKNMASAISYKTYKDFAQSPSKSTAIVTTLMFLSPKTNGVKAFITQHRKEEDEWVCS